MAVTICTLLIGCDSEPAICAHTDPSGCNASGHADKCGSDSNFGGAFSNAQSGPITAARAAAWSPTIRWRGGDRYLLGVNYPYFHYGNDFGGNAWGSYGVHDPTTYAAVDADFAKMESLGIHTVRWFVFTDGRAGITFDAAGMPTGIDEFVTKDFDAALEIAQRHNVGINFVLTRLQVYV